MEEKEISILIEKNDYLIGLRNHLMEQYNTKEYWMSGENGCESKIIGKGDSVAYVSVKRDTTLPKELGSFSFRKDLCGCSQLSEKQVVKDMYDFTRKKGLNSELAGNEKAFDVSIGENKYLMSANIGRGCADEIAISVIKLYNIGVLLEKIINAQEEFQEEYY